MIAVCTLPSFSEAQQAAKYTSTCRFHRLKFSDTFPEFTSRWGGSLNCPVSVVVISLTKSRGCHHVDLLVRVENEEHDKSRKQHYGFIREPPLREHMVRSEGSWELETYFMCAALYYQSTH